MADRARGMLSVGERFHQLLGSIEPRATDIERVQNRLSRISQRLREDFDVPKLWTVGSHWKGTAVRRFSDFDLFVVLRRDEVLKWSPNGGSATILTRVRNSVRRSYPNTRLRIDQQAVLVPFEQGAHAIDVVPAVFESFDPGSRSPIYLIPDGDGGWLRAAPEMQKKYLDEADLRSGRKLKGLVKLLKWWGAARAATSSLTSLYIEQFIAAHGVRIGPTYQEAFAETLDAMARNGCPPLTDPLGISRRPFEAAKTARQRSALVGAAAASADRAGRALEREYLGRTQQAIWTWSLVFNHSLPGAP